MHRSWKIYKLHIVTSSYKCVKLNVHQLHVVDSSDALLQVFVCGAWEALGLLHSCADQFYPTQIPLLGNTGCRVMRSVGGVLQKHRQFVELQRHMLIIVDAFCIGSCILDYFGHFWAISGSKRGKKKGDIDPKRDATHIDQPGLLVQRR